MVLNRIPCEYNNKFDMWAADDLAPLYMLFLSIIAYYPKPNKPKNHSSTFVYYLLFLIMDFNVTLRKKVWPKPELQDPFCWPCTLVIMHMINIIT